MQNVIICGNYGAHNIGDEAILLSALNLIKNKYKKITVFSATPIETTTIYGIASVNFIPTGIRSLLRSYKTLTKTLKSLKNSEVFILGGGGLLQDEDKKACFIWFIQVLFAKFFGLKIEIFANSIGPLNTFYGKFFTKKVLTWAETISVRDQKSLEYVNNLAPDKKATLVKDPVLTYKPQKYTKKNQIAISLRHWHSHQDQVLEELKKFLYYLINKTEFDVLLVPFGFKDTEILKCLLISKRVKLLNYSDNVEEVLKIVSESKLLIGMRLHSLIFSYICNTPFIGLSYTDKVIEFCKTIGKENHCFDLKDVSEAKLREKFRKILK